MNTGITQSNNFKLAITGAFGALSVILGVTRLGYISLSPVISFTIMHIPVILATLISGLIPGLGTAFIFGLTSLIQASVQPSGVLDPFFQNPLISILPRLLIPVVTWAVQKGLDKIHLPQIVSGGIAAALGSCANSFFVALALCTFTLTKFKEAFPGWGFKALLVAFFVPGGALEAAASVVITVAVLSGILIASITKKSKLTQEMQEFENLTGEEN